SAPAMTLNNVVLPAPLGPISPTTSVSPTLKLTLETAVKPPKRLLTLLSSSSTGAPPALEPIGNAAHYAFRHYPDDDDQQNAVHHQIQPAALAAPFCAQVQLEGSDQDGTKNRA